MDGLASGDLRFDPAGSQLSPVLVVVIAAVGGDPVGASTRPPDLAADGRDALDKRNQLRDVVAVASGDRPGERDPSRIYEKVMLGAVSGSINRARARRGAPFFACTWLESATARDHSISPAALEFGEQDLVQSLPDTGPLPLIHAAVTSRAAAEAELSRQMPPRDPGVEHKQNPLQRPPIRQPLRPG